MRKSCVNFLIKIPIRYLDIKKIRQGITSICCTLICVHLNTAV